jgi:pSer/pThr/pTyr-binding forkhead associated (FHA) protein
MARLVVLTEGFTGLSHELKGEKVTIGRVEDNTFQIAESSVSSHHCEITQKGEELLVKDLNSTNGTFIDGDQITEGSLKPGHILRLGKVEIRFETGVVPAGRQPMEKTMVLPQGGVRANEFDKGTRTSLEGAPFPKKSNKTNTIFIGIGIALGVIIVILLVLVFLKMGG